MLKQKADTFISAFANERSVIDSLKIGDLVPPAVCMGLTARQRDVLAVMMQGKSNKAICRVLNLAEPTVKNHVTAILKALKVTNRTEAVIKVAKASVASMSYRYTISGQSTFLAPIGEPGQVPLERAPLDVTTIPPISDGRFPGSVSTDVRVRNIT
jgi:DNA-binding CsgD family transcriptional regulator